MAKRIRFLEGCEDCERGKHEKVIPIAEWIALCDALGATPNIGNYPLAVGSEGCIIPPKIGGVK